MDTLATMDIVERFLVDSQDCWVQQCDLEDDAWRKQPQVWEWFLEEFIGVTRLMNGAVIISELMLSSMKSIFTDGTFGLLRFQGFVRFSLFPCPQSLYFFTLHT